MAILFGRESSVAPGVKVDPIVWALAGAAAVELAILRTFTRTAIHIPGLEAMRYPYQLLTKGGEFAYFLTISLLFPVAAALLLAMHRGHYPQRWLVTFGVALFAFSWPLVDMHAVSPRTLDALTISSVVAIGSAIVLTSRRTAWLPIVTFTAAFTASALYTTSLGSGRGAGFGQPDLLLNYTEFLGLAYACTTPLLVHRSRDRMATGVAIAVGMLVYVAMLGNGSTSRFLLLWNAGLSGTLPSFFYGLAAAALTYTTLRAGRSGLPLVSSGLVMIVAGGLGLHSSYQSALVIVGTMSLALGLSGARQTLVRRDLAPQPEPMPAAL